jgi:TfoX/Sxy family transcriptional regulator of competence genes
MNVINLPNKIADRVRAYLSGYPELRILEKKMFGGLAFMVNGKMCINVSGENLMCRFDPEWHEKISSKRGFKKMIMKERELKGYCYVEPNGLTSKKDFEYWANLCLDYNKKAKSSKKKK